MRWLDRSRSNDQLKAKAPRQEDEDPRHRVQIERKGAINVIGLCHLPAVADPGSLQIEIPVSSGAA